MRVRSVFEGMALATVLFAAARDIPIDGTIVVVDPFGIERAEEDGTLTPVFRPRVSGDPEAPKPDDRTGEPVDVRHGRFHLDVPADCDFGVAGAKLGGRTAEIESGFVTPAAGTPVTIRATWIKSVRLHVVDAATHAELDDVCVVRRKSPLPIATRLEPPGELDEIVLEHATSPLEVTASKDPLRDGEIESVRVRARDHAWARLELDYESGRDARVELEPAAALIVVLGGELPTPDKMSVAELMRALSMARGTSRFDDGGARLRLRKSVPTAGRGWTLLDRPAALGETHLDSLPPGEFTVSVELGERDRSPLVAGKASVTLVAGATARVELALAHVETAKRVAVSGTIFVPDGWLADDEDSDTPELVITPLDLPGQTRWDEQSIDFDHMTRLPDRPGWYRWSMDAVSPSTWTLKVEAAGYSRKLFVSEAGATDVEITLAESATLRVRAVDAREGQPVKVDRIVWNAKAGTPEVFDLRFDEKSASFRGRVPAGEGRLEVADLTSGWIVEEDGTPTTLHAGAQELVARVHPSTRVLLRFAWDGRPARLQRFALSDVRIAPVAPDVSKDERIRQWIGHDLTAFVLTAPGRYRVTFPEFPGFQPIAPIELDVAAETTVERTITLTLR